MRGEPITLLEAGVTSAVVGVVFVAVGALMLRRARNPSTKPRDFIEKAILPKLKSPTPRERCLFFLGVAGAMAAPWLTYVLQTRFD